MIKPITAQEAYSIASGEYEKQMNKKVLDNLDRIYERIRTASQHGSMEVDVAITICLDFYKNKLGALLEQNGFQCRFYYDEIDGDDCVTVSWKHLN